MKTETKTKTAETTHLRDLHAGLALVGLLMSDRGLSADGLARAAYRVADVMQEARETSKPEEFGNEKQDK